ncbi:ABC transporter permease [Alkaliflexus imshenetskii]|uniref:ABC transporter permease n=1 Tax=Alkaliflexus imshenetskii TaxID=286730 RepID=UPI00047E500E|nr:FtsX-like permease family protein [Alkaliflexus imshenetskii]
MKPEFFIAQKIRSGGVSGKKFAGPVLKVAVGGIVLGMVVMILSIAIGSGFKKEIREKIVGFGSHIHVVNYDFNLSYEANPIRNDENLVAAINALEGVRAVQRFATKPGLLKTDSEMQGVILKGIGPDYDISFLQSILVEGELPATSSESPSVDILISSALSGMLHLNVGDPVFMYFFQEQIRVRRFNVTGIYDSNLPDLDKMYVVADIRQIQRLNGWDEDQMAGYEILIHDFDRIDEVGMDVYDIAATYISAEGTLLRTQTIKQTQPQIFGWLDLLDMNIAVIIVLIVLVAGFNMISGLLILILERTNMIGILKALGMDNWPLRKIFLYLATHIALRGLIWGNVIGLGICILQQQFGIVKLDPANYFLDTVPVSLNLVHLLILNAGALVAVFLMMIGPSYLAARISPVRAILFD